MTLTSYFFGISSAAIVLLVVIELLRRRHLRERHAIWWMVAGFLALIAGVFPQSLDWAAALIGIEVPINLVFFAAIAVLFLVSLQYSSELTQLESKTRTLAERVALIELELRSLRERQDSESQDGPLGHSAPHPGTAGGTTESLLSDSIDITNGPSPIAEPPRVTRHERHGL